MIVDMPEPLVFPRKYLRFHKQHTPLGGPGAQKPVFGRNTATFRFLGPKNAFWREKCKMEPQGGKNGKREPKTPKKPLSRARFAEGCRNDPKKGLKAEKRVLLRPKPLFGVKVAFGGKSAEKSEKVRKG